MKVNHLSFSYNHQSYMKDINIQFKDQKITTIIGPNGSGKSTLLMLLSRIYKIQQGSIELDNKNIWDYKIKEFARKVAVVHQKNQVYGDLNVRTIIGYGRLPYLNYHQSLSKEDKQIIDWAIEVTNLKEHQNKMLNSLSGGQQQRVWIALALAQKTPILLLDEPTTYLDVKAQIETLNLLRKINKEYQITIIMVHHDINQAIHYSDEIIAMKNGQLMFQGKPHDVINQKSLKEVYEYDLNVIKNNEELFMKKIILFLSLFCILCIPSQVNAYNYENISQIEYLEDGSYIETTIFVSNDYARSQKTASKIARYNSSTGVQQWYVTVTGTFSYGNGSAKCISSSVKSGVYNNKWAISSKSASKSGATAIASATAKHSYDNTAYETKKLTVRLTCSSTGVLS